MIVAGLLDMSGDYVYLKKELHKIPLDNYAIKFSYQKEGHIKMGRFIVEDTASVHQHYQYAEILAKVGKASLSGRVKKNITRIYNLLYRAEKKVHRTRTGHFHQLGEVDSIIDIAASCILIDRLNVGKVFYSSVPFGKRVAPATVELLRAQDIYFSSHPFENITPTGAAILAGMGTQITRNKNKKFALRGAGYGRGSFDSCGYANGIRAMLLESKRPSQGARGSKKER